MAVVGLDRLPAGLCRRLQCRSRQDESDDRARRAARGARCLASRLARRGCRRANLVSRVGSPRAEGAAGARAEGAAGARAEGAAGARAEGAAGARAEGAAGARAEGAAGARAEGAAGARAEGAAGARARGAAGPRAGGAAEARAGGAAEARAEGAAEGACAGGGGRRLVPKRAAGLPVTGSRGLGVSKPESGCIVRVGWALAEAGPPTLSRTARHRTLPREKTDTRDRAGSAMRREQCPVAQ